MMSIFVLKIIAAISMVIDHIRYIIPEMDTDITKMIGRFAFIIFAFVFTEGVWHTSDRIKYLKRIMFFAVASQIPYMLFRTIVGAFVVLNILFTFAVAMIFIILIDRQKDKKLKIILGIIAVLSGTIIPLDYGVYGITLSLMMYYTRKTILFDIGFIIINIIYYYNNINEVNGRYEILIPYMIGSILGYVILKLYNGKLGKKIKFLYWFYPVHLLIIQFIYLFLNDISLISL